MTFPWRLVLSSAFQVMFSQTHPERFGGGFKRWLWVGGVWRFYLFLINNPTMELM